MTSRGNTRVFLQPHKEDQGCNDHLCDLEEAEMKQDSNLASVQTLESSSGILLSWTTGGFPLSLWEQLRNGKWKCWLLSHAPLCNPMDCSPHGSSVHGILQAIILEWVAIPFSRRSSRPRDQTHVSWSPALQADSLPSEPPGKPSNQSVHP